MVTWEASQRLARSQGALGIILCWGLMAPEVAAACRPPGNLFVCQDRYGPAGRAFLSWTLGEPDYTGVRVYLDGQLEGEGSGDARSGYVTDIPVGAHTFEVEGLCADGTTVRTSKTFQTVWSSPFTQPVTSMECRFDAQTSELRVTWTPGPRKALFIDVYFRRSGSPDYRYVKTLAGDATQLTIERALPDDLVMLQLFDESCYGSELVACPGPACEPPARFHACQDLYAPNPRVFLDWLQIPSEYTGFQLFVDGVLEAQVGADVGLFYLTEVELGTRRFGIRGVCGAEATELFESTLEVLASSPHDAPAENLTCRHDATARTITATWLPGARPSEFIDVYIRHAGNPLFDFVVTIDGAATRVRVADADADDQLILQFFDATCHGSPLQRCGDDVVSDRFLRGDADGSANVDITDGIFVLRFLFIGEAAPLCRDAADANDDAKLDIADAIYILSWLFSGGPVPPAPGPTQCGTDPTPDDHPGCLTAACE